MQRPPELTPDEQKTLDMIVDAQVKDFIEEKHIHEIPTCLEGLCEIDEE